MKKVFLYLIIVFITMLSINLNVSAETCSDLSNYECEQGKGVELNCIYDYVNDICKSTQQSGSNKNKVSCGNITNIPNKIPRLTSFAIVLLQVATSVILVIMGSIDLFKGITSSKEEEMKKGQQIFVKRLITAALVFFVILIVKLFIGAIANSKSAPDIVSCMDCFLSNSCKKTDISETAAISNDKESSVNKIIKTNQKEIKVNTSKANTSKTDTSKTNTTKKETSKNTTNSKSTNKKSNTIFIGDSEVVLMCDEYGLCGNDKSFSEGGVDCGFLDSIKSSVNSTISSKEYNIVILLGFNGAGVTSSEGTSEAEWCYNKVYNLAQKDWKNQNIVYVSVNPCDDDNAEDAGMYITNTAINSFNKRMKSLISSSGLSNLSYCDTNSSLNIKEIDLGDGAHYTKAGEQKVYNTIKNKCL